MTETPLVQSFDPNTGTRRTLVGWNTDNNAAGNALTSRPKQRIAFGNDEGNVIDGTDETRFGDRLCGFGGNDGLAGGTGDDTLEGGAGDDLIKGDTGADSLAGGAGNDVILGSALGDVRTPTAVGQEREAVPAAMEAFTQGFSWSALRTPGPRIDGNNELTFKVASVAGAFTGVAWQDAGQWYVESSGNFIDGGAGDDYIGAGTAADIAHGGEGDDDIFGQDDADVLFGDAGADAIVGDGFDSTDPNAVYARGLWYLPGIAHGDDVIDGGAGNDWLWGTGGNDEIYGGAEDDQLWGDGSLTQVAAEWHGNDYLDGGSGTDKMVGQGRELNSFVVTAVSYERHSSDGSLDLYDPATGQGAMTERYIADRAAMPIWKLLFERDGARDESKPLKSNRRTTGRSANEAAWRVRA